MLPVLDERPRPAVSLSPDLTLSHPFLSLLRSGRIPYWMSANTLQMLLFIIVQTFTSMLNSVVEQAALLQVRRHQCGQGVWTECV